MASPHRLPVLARRHPRADFAGAGAVETAFAARLLPEQQWRLEIVGLRVRHRRRPI